jgi:hypothetical protein
MDELMYSDDETMFVALMEEEAEIAAGDDEDHLIILSYLMALYACYDAKPRRLDVARSSRDRGWKATTFSTPTTSPMTHCMASGNSAPFYDEPEALPRHCQSFDNYFICKKDCTGMVGFSSLQKCTAALRMLAYGAPSDSHDDYISMTKSTTMECMYRFCKAMVSVFGPDYMRTPNKKDTARILAHNEARGFPGMLGSIDCMHWKCKNCPFTWQDMYKGHK